MSNLLKFNLHNLFRQKSFYISMIVIVLMSSLVLITPVIIGEIMHKSFDAITLSSSLKTLTEPTGFKLLVGIFVSLFCTLDVANDTLKNIIGRGFKRSNVYITNFISSIIGTTVIYIGMIVISIIISLIFGKMTGLSSTLFVKLLANYLIIVACTSLYCLISILINKTSGALITCILINVLGSTFLTLFETLLSLKSKITISDYWIGSIDSSKTLMAIIISVIYIVGCLIIGMILSKNKEIK